MQGLVGLLKEAGDLVGREIREPPKQQLCNEAVDIGASGVQCHGQAYTLAGEDKDGERWTSLSHVCLVVAD